MIDPILDAPGRRPSTHEVLNRAVHEHLPRCRDRRAEGEHQRGQRDRKNRRPFPPAQHGQHERGEERRGDDEDGNRGLVDVHEDRILSSSSFSSSVPYRL